MANERDIGCLLIEDPLYGVGCLYETARALGRRGVRTEVFRWDARARLYPSLQRAYQRVRRDSATNAIVAQGTGCDCALALSCQLPADRLVLLEPVQWRESGDAARQLRRIRAFARQNAAFCVADALIVPGPHTPDGLPGRLLRDLSAALSTLSRELGELWPVRKEDFNLALFQYLSEGVLPKSLAE